MYARSPSIGSDRYWKQVVSKLMPAELKIFVTYLVACHQVPASVNEGTLSKCCKRCKHQARGSASLNVSEPTLTRLYMRCNDSPRLDRKARYSACSLYGLKAPSTLQRSFGSTKESQMIQAVAKSCPRLTLHKLEYSSTNTQTLGPLRPACLPFTLFTNCS